MEISNLLSSEIISSSTMTTRLMITKMILENFKSYAGVQEIGPFHKRFSSIVGPNGSGKSNVIDALLFVFGKRAKQLRLNKVSELIHKSSNFPNLEYAKVEIYFQLIRDDENSEDDYEVVPGSEFLVSRTAYKNNQSKYSVDGKNSSYTEVGALLRQHGIDLDNNRFLILQGEVEQIAMMKPKAQPPNEDGLLEYLEDIIGSNRYVGQIEEKSKEVEQLNEVRVERAKRVQLCQSDRESLEQPRAEAVAYLERESNIRHKNNLLYQIYINECEVNIEALSAKLQGYQERLKEEKAKEVELDKSLKSLDKLYQQIRGEYEQLTNEMQKTADDFAAYERRDTKMIEDMKYVKSEIQKLEASIKKETAKQKESHAQIVQYQTDIAQLKEDLAAIQIRKEKTEKHLDEVMGSLQDSTASLREELEQAQMDLTESDRSVAEIQTEKESLETAINLVDSRVESASKSIETIQAKLRSLENEESDIHSGRASKDSLRRNLSSRRDTLSQSLDNLKRTQTDLQSRIRQAVSASEESKAAMQAQQSSPGAVRPEIVSILKQTKSGGCLAGVGVRGRLGDLGAIDHQYDIAISTACSCLDYIVVDSNEAANACIDYLKATNSGRASFIVLDQLGHSTAKMDAPIRVPQGTQRLFDLIRPKEPTFRGAFYMALRDTLVTDDWDLATRVAYEGDKVKWRIVTTSGNLIDTSGSMTGGGKPPTSGGMKAQNAKAETTVTQEQIAQLDADVTRLQGELGQCRNDMMRIEKELKETDNQLKQIHLDLEKSDLQLSRISSEKQDLGNRLFSLQSSCSLTRDEIAEKKSLERKLNDVIRRIDQLSPNRNQLQAKVKEIQHQILEVGGPGLKRAQAKVDSVSSEFAACQSSISAKEAALSTALKQQTKSSSSLKKAEAELGSATERKANLETEHKQMENDAASVLLAQERAKQAALAKEKELENFKAEYKEFEEKIKVVREVEVDLRSNFDNCNKLLKENESKRTVFLKELNKVRKQHEEDVQEFRVFFENLPHSQDGEDESKESNSDKSDPPISKFIQPLRVYTQEEMMETLGLSTLNSIAHIPKPAPSHKRGKSKKYVEPSDEEDSSDDPKRVALDALKGEINMMEADRDRLKSAVNMTALLEYKRKDEEFRSRLEELEEITGRRNNARKEYEDLRRKRLEEFMSGFGIITLKLKEMYQMITLGGDAELELVDSLDPFSEGIVFSVRPPKKSWKNISNLSGGEKTLSSLALVFALHHFKPTPLYVMDEIDAALDFKNVSIVANYIKQRTKNAQFVIISLRNNMFELANRLVGIYKTHDTTKSVTINPHCFENAVTGHPSSSTLPSSTSSTLKVDEKDDISSSPAPKKGRQNKYQPHERTGEENEETNQIDSLSSSLKGTERRANARILGDSTNKV